MSWWYSWVVSFCQFPYLTFVTKFEPLCGLKKIVSSTVSVCDPLNISVVGGKLFCCTVTVSDHFPRIVFSLVHVKQKVSGGQEQEQVFVAMEFTVQVSTFLLNKSCYGIGR